MSESYKPESDNVEQEVLREKIEEKLPPTFRIVAESDMENGGGSHKNLKNQGLKGKISSDANGFSTLEVLKPTGGFEIYRIVDINEGLNGTVVTVDCLDYKMSPAYFYTNVSSSDKDKSISDPHIPGE